MHKKHSANMNEWMHTFLAVERMTDGYILPINNKKINFSRGPAKSCSNLLLERQQQDYIVRIDVSDFVWTQISFQVLTASKLSQ